MKKIFRAVFVSSGFCLGMLVGFGQQRQATDSLPDSASLPLVVQYALKHYPLAQQSLLDEQITDRQIRSKLADWLPQLNLNGSYQNNFALQKIAFNGAYVSSGAYNTSTVALGLTQNIFNRDVLLASRTRGDAMKLTKQNSTTNRIDIAVNVSKAFYEVLLTQKQIEVLNDDIRRLERNLKDTYNQYQGGIVDKTDYKRATISLNNSKAQRKANEEALKARYATLLQLMGYNGKDSIHLQYDSTQMQNDIVMDTLTPIDYTKRIEYQALMTRKKLQQYNLQYEKWSFLPSLSANAGYNFYYLNNRFSKLYADNLPTSYAGLTLSFPIFQGTKRTQNIRIAELQITRMDWDIVELQNSIRSEYAQAMANYKSNLNEYYILKDNRDLAREVYNTIKLQYNSGIKTYLEVITAETDVRTAESNYSDALYNVLSSKLDVEKALGTLNY